MGGAWTEALHALSVGPELDHGCHRDPRPEAPGLLAAEITRSAVHPESPADRSPTEAPETPHRPQARVSTHSAPPPGIGQHLLMLIFEILHRGPAATPLVLLQLLCAHVSGPELP